MIKVLATAGIVIALGVATQGSFAADEPFAKEVKARKAVMQVYSFNLGILGAMAKGKMPYDAKVAQNAADNLNAAVNMKNGAMWPKGSDNGALGDRTRAKPEAWSKYPEVAEKSKMLKEAAAMMAAAAGSGVDALPGTGPVRIPRRCCRAAGVYGTRVESAVPGTVLCGFRLRRRRLSRAGAFLRRAGCCATR